MGNFNGSLKDVEATTPGGIVIAETVKKSGVVGVTLPLTREFSGFPVPVKIADAANSHDSFLSLK